ncbi:unnamed protein product [Protopolystoma xenopodis]|uniref:Uncharacterized protein n=1 Tax=Protopolystoma xenopodis TaxID=117903 RepID=A0A3S5AE22_9PLAT|nr:unnamed protein product [Protopolystoma xenopodis]
MNERSARSHRSRKTVRRGLLRTIQQTQVQGNPPALSVSGDAFSERQISRLVCRNRLARQHQVLSTRLCELRARTEVAHVLTMAAENSTKTNSDINTNDPCSCDDKGKEPCLDVIKVSKIAARDHGHTLLLRVPSTSGRLKLAEARQNEMRLKRCSTPPCLQGFIDTQNSLEPLLPPEANLQPGNAVTRRLYNCTEISAD